MRNRGRVQGIRVNNRGGKGSAMGPGNLRRRWRHRRREMSKKNTTTTMEASADDRRRVQGIGDDTGGSSGLTTVPVDWQRQRSVDFPFYCVANSNNVSSLSRCCLVLILPSSYSFFLVHCKKYYQYCNHAENISASSVH